MRFDAKQFEQATLARHVRAGPSGPCAGVVTDTRGDLKGKLFCALKGPHFDGHDFCGKALSSGAWGCVVRNGHSVEGEGWVFETESPLRALGDIAGWWRSRFSVHCVGITGSNGKTTTKEMLASILKTRWRVLKTEGNFNNLIGLPLTLDRLTPEDEALVLEMGMNDFGEIYRLAKIAQPTVACVTNAAAAHLEKLGDVEAVARAKCELFDAMGPEGILVYNADDPGIVGQMKKYSQKKVVFSMGKESPVHFEHMESADLRTMALKLSVEGKILEARMQTSGLHNVLNAMAACATAHALGFPVEAMQEGLEKFRPLAMRMEQIQLANGVRLVNDAYNANPVSMEAAFRAVGRAKRAGRFIAVLGDMKELGPQSARLHREVGEKAAACGVEKLFLTGEFARETARGAESGGLKTEDIRTGADNGEILECLARELKAGDIVLVKASRAVRLEEIAEGLKEKFGD